MFLKRGIAIAITLLLLLSLSACKPGGGEGPKGEATPALSGELKGYYASDQSIKGGQESIDVNLKNIEMKKDGKDTVITFSFVQGSEDLGVEEASVEKVPYYSTGFLTDPYRFTLQIEGLDYWDYKNEFKGDGDSLFQGMFKQLPIDSNVTTFYIHLNSQVAYKIEEKKDQLMLFLRPVEGKAQKAFYVVLNAYAEYQEADFPQDIEMKPSLCEDGRNVVLLSKPFANKGQAERYQKEVTNKLKDMYPNKLAEVIELEANQLPSYNAQTDLKGIEQKPMVKKGDKTLTLPILAADGRFLCWTPDGKFYLFAKPLPEQQSDEQDIPQVNEELWIGAVGGEQRRLLDYEFSPINQVSFSPDGKKLALMEQQMGDDNWLLYMYDMEKKGELVNLVEEGLGINTTTFAWSEDSKVLYAMSGEEALQLMSYDTTLSEGERVSAIEDVPGADGDVASANGRIYFSNETEGAVGKIFYIDPADKQKKEFAKGSSFKISPDGKWMAIVEVNATVNEEMQTSLKVKNLSSGEEKTISEKSLVMDYNWASDSKSVYYAVDKGEQNSDAFSTTIRRFDLSSEKEQALIDTITSDFYPSNVPGQILLVDMYTVKGDYIPVTYIVDFEKLGK